MESKKARVSILILRFALGALFLYAGLDKVLNNFDSSSYLTNAVTGPFADIFRSMAESSLVNFLVIFGECAIGLALVLGAFVRLAAMSGSLMMILFYLSTIPQKNGPISQHIIYIACFIVLAFTNAGLFYGLDKVLEENKFIKSNWNIFKYLLG